MKDNIGQDWKEIDLKIYFNKNVTLELDKIDEVISGTKTTAQNNADIVRYWWKSFYINSRMLGVLIKQWPAYYQFAMTTRRLLETAADLDFISNNPRNIPHLIKEQQKVQEKQSRKTAFTQNDAIKCSRNFRLYLDTYNNKRIAIGTKERVRLVDDENNTILKIYDMVSAACHFNHIQMIWEGNKATDKDFLVDLTNLLCFYPLFLAIAVKSIGKIIGNDELASYDETEMKEALDELRDKFSADNTDIRW